jgi:hypothetical protein
MAVSNKERAARGRKAFESVPHDADEPLAQLTDLIADLLHLADEIAVEQGLGTDHVGEWAAEKATFDYREECDEEAAAAFAEAA